MPEEPQPKRIRKESDSDFTVPQMGKANKPTNSQIITDSEQEDDPPEEVMKASFLL